MITGLLATLRYYMVFGQIEGLGFFIAGIMAYLIVKGSVIFLSIIRTKTVKHHLRTLVPPLVAFFLLLFVILPLTGLIVETVVTNPAAPVKVNTNNDRLMMLDQTIFHTYPAFWFHSTLNPSKPLWDALSPLILESYHNLSIALGITFLLLLVFNQLRFLQMGVAFFACVVISAPIWYFFPSLSPFEAYIYRSVDRAVPPQIAAMITTLDINEGTARFHTAIVQEIQKHQHIFLAVTTFPSMHIAWAAIICYFTYRLWKPLLIVSFPYFFLNLIATIYTMQHYTLDLPAGLIVAVSAITIAQLLVPKLSPTAQKAFAFIKDDLAYIQRIGKKIVG